MYSIQLWVHGDLVFHDDSKQFHSQEIRDLIKDYGLEFALIYGEETKFTSTDRDTALYVYLWRGE